ncbi:MAG: site-2 protease family protein [Planctomycetota bacterium]
MNSRTAETSSRSSRTPLRLRADLRWVELAADLGARWRVKDPVSLDYHEVGGEEHFLLQQFDGQATPEQIAQRYAKRFPPRRISPARLQQFAADAYRRGLLIADGDGQAEETLRRAGEHRGRQWLARLGSVLFLRLPGVDPAPLLAVLGPVTRWCFWPGTIAAVLLAALLTLVLLLGQAGTLAARLPTAGQWLQPGALVGLLIAFVAVKVVHELAHALACRAVGARCHEIGVLLVAMVPCLYCDVSDAWMVRSRWRRMLVSAAGMYAELVVAVVCAWLWMATPGEGPLAAALLSLMVACGVSTLLFNANPLLKLDGYYLLSDLTGVPNLHERSRRALVEPLANRLRSPAARRPTPPESPWLAAFGLASMAYRVVVLAVIAWAAYAVLDAWGVRPLGDVLIALTLLGLATPAVIWMAKTLRSPLARRAWRLGRVALAGAAAAGAVVVLLLIPIERTVTAPMVVEFAQTKSIAATAPGRLVEMVAEGQSVDAGGVIARLENPELERRRLRLATEARSLREHATSTRKRANRQPALLAQAPTAEAAAERAERDLQQLDKELERLTIVAPADGVVVGAAIKAPADGGDELPGWEGRLTDRQNLGCWVEAGDVLCLVSPADPRLEATLAIDPADALGVRPGLPTRVLVYQSSGPVATAPLGELARTQADRVAPGLATHPDLAMRKAFDEASAPAQPLLLARVDLPGDARGVRHGSLGLTKIEVGRETPAAMLWRRLARWFPLLR